MGCVLRMKVVGTGQLPNSTGVVFGVGFPTYSRCSFENTPMHHRSEGTLPGLHTLRIRGRLLFSRWPFSLAFRCGGVDFAWDVHNSVK